MKRVFIFFLLLSAGIAACKKYNSLRDDINGNLYIRGRLVRVNNITNLSDSSYISNETVQLGLYPDTLNYIFTTTTDANGYFVFNNLTQGNIYMITVNDTSGGLKYNGKDSVQLKTSRNVLVYSLPSEYGQNGIVYTVNTVDGGAVNGCTVCMFNSLILYQYAKSKDSCVNASYNLITNAAGRVSQFNMLPGTYYTLFRDRLNKDTVLRDSDLFTVKTQGIIYREPNIIIK